MIFRFSLINMISLMCLIFKMADWKDNDDLPMQAEKTFFSHPIDNLDL